MALNAGLNGHSFFFPIWWWFDGFRQLICAI